ncbi:MAG: hypothetical protein Q8O67_32650 [Deltaproteobacteria bacterium]|nr:hypothetical protein [Deltaproteobacteria bacterium]
MTQQLVEKAAADALPSTLGFAGALMLLALLAHFVLELRKVQTGQTPDYGRAVAVVLVHIVLLAQYPVFSGFVLDLAGGITQGGNINAVEIQQTQAHALARRYAKFQKNASDRSTVRTVLEAVPETDTGSAGVDNATRTLREAGADLADALPDGMPGFPVGLATFLSTSPSAFIDRLFETLADIVMGFIFVATSAVLLLLSIVQKAALVLLIAAGPIVIVLSAFPGPTSGFLFSWVLTLFEVSMWGFTTRLLSTILSARFGEVPTSATGGNLSGVVAGDASTNFAGYFENIAFCGVLAGAYVMVPVLTSGLFRGGLASQGGQMLGQATGFATGIATGRLAGAMPGRGSSPLAAATDASGATGPGAAGAARAGDSGVPSSGGMTKGEAIAKHRAIQNHQRAGDRD